MLRLTVAGAYSVFDPKLLLALSVPSAASAATAKYQVPGANPVISWVVVVPPLTATDWVRSLSVVP